MIVYYINNLHHIIFTSLFSSELVLLAIMHIFLKIYNITLLLLNKIICCSTFEDKTIIQFQTCILTRYSAIHNPCPCAFICLAGLILEVFR